MSTAVRVTLVLFILSAFLHPAASEGFPRVPILGEVSLCQEFTSFNGTPVRTRHHGNNCRIPTVLNPERNATHEINLVLMAPGSGAIGDALTQAEPYISLALQSVEDNSSILPGYRLQIYLADDRCSAPDAAANVIRALSTGPPKHALVGPACSAACIATNDAVQYFNIPQMSQSCTSLELSDYVRHPFFARLCPSYMNGVIATQALLVQWRWFRVGVVHDHRAVLLTGKDVLLNLLEDASQHQWTVLMVQQVSNPVQCAETMVEARQRDARVITNVMYEDVGSWLLCETYKQKMLPPFWVQVIISQAS